MLAAGNRQFCTLAVVFIVILTILAYNNLSKKAVIYNYVQTVEKQDNYIKDAIHKYQDCLRMSQEWSYKYDSQRKQSDDLKSRLDSVESDRQKSESQLKEALKTAQSRVDLLEGQVKSLTADKAAASSNDRESPEEAKESKELVQLLRHQLAELQQKLKLAVAPSSADKSQAAGQPAPQLGKNVTVQKL